MRRPLYHKTEVRCSVADVRSVRGLGNKLPFKVAITALISLLGLCWTCPAEAKYSGGAGTASNPYLISTAEDLQDIGSNPGDWGEHFRLTTDIDMGSASGLFHPIGYYRDTDDNLPFTGEFDGYGKAIRNFSYSTSQTGAAGLFGYISGGGSVKNLSLVDPGVSVGAEYFCVGALVGMNRSGTISDCRISGGSVSAAQRGQWWSIGGVGGLAGENRGTISDCSVEYVSVSGKYQVGGVVGGNGGSISSCSSSGTVSGDECVGGLAGASIYGASVSGSSSTAGVGGRLQVGGLVGYLVLATVETSFCEGDVSGDEEVGGAVGHNHGGTICECYSSAGVGAGHSAGGLVGANLPSCNCGNAIPGVVVDSCSTGGVSGSGQVGGVAGTNAAQADIMGCYFAGMVSGSEDVGGLAGLNSGSIESSYWDVEASGTAIMCGATGVGGHGCDDGYGKTTAEMKHQATFAGWDFAATWTIKESQSYPLLRGLGTGGGPPPIVIRAPIVVNTSKPANPVGKTKATLWGMLVDNGGGACEYRFRYRPEGGDYVFTEWTAGAAAGKMFSETIRNLAPGETFYGSSQARNSSAESDWTSEFSFTMGPAPLVLTILSLEGGSVVAPGEGQFNFNQPTGVAVTAVAQPGYHFTKWTGTAVTAGLVAALEAPEAGVEVDDDYTLCAHFASERTALYVDDDAPADPGPRTASISDPHEDGSTLHPFDRIQEAINVAPDGATVFVRPGTYYENVNLSGKPITVTSFEPDRPRVVSEAVIDGNSLGTVVRFENGEDSRCVLRGFVITGGQAGDAGGIRCQNSRPTISNCLITGNRITSFGGGAVYCMMASPRLDHCTIAGNYTGNTGAGLLTLNSEVTVSNSILWDNQPADMAVASGASPDVTYSNVLDDSLGEGNKSILPRFVRAGWWVDAADPNRVVQANYPWAEWVAGDYHLMSRAGRWDPAAQAWVTDGTTSPCIDAANPASDWAAELWPNGRRANMGAFGGTAEASMSTSLVGNTADLNSDGKVNWLDLAGLGSRWLECGAFLRENLDRAGAIDMDDLGLFASYWRMGQ